VGSGFHAGWERAAADLSPVPHDWRWGVLSFTIHFHDWVLQHKASCFIFFLTVSSKDDEKIIALKFCSQ
jgi:hypothetical protein